MNLSIKDVPQPIVLRLRQRAKENHRSLQGELLSIIEQAAGGQKLTIDEVYHRAKARAFSTPSESAAIIREDRDSRSGD